MAKIYWRRFVSRQPIYSAPGDLRINGLDRKPVRKTFSQTVTPGQYEVRVRRTTSDEVNDRMTKETQISAFRFKQSMPYETETQTRVGMLVKATSQLNGQFNQYSAVVLAGAASLSDPRATVKSQNPALWFLRIARGIYARNGRLLAGAGLPDSRIDLETIAQWAEFCDLNRLYFNYEFKDRTTVNEALSLIAKVGRASLDLSGHKLSVVWDKPNQSPVAIFGPQNIFPGTFSVSYNAQKTADELVVSFADADKDYEQNTVRIKVPGATTVGLNTADLTMPGVVYKDQVVREANLIAAAQVWRRRRITWETDYEGYLIRRGQVVILSHDMTEWDASGRIFDSTSRSSVTLDKEVQPTSDAWLAVMHPNSPDITYHRVATFTQPTATLDLLDDLPVIPGGDGDHVAADYTWCFGPAKTPGKLVKIVSREPIDKNRVRITAMDEYPQYYASEFNPYAFVPPAFVVGRAPGISNLKITFDQESADGVSQLMGFLSWEIFGVGYKEANVYIGVDNNPPVFRGTTKGRTFAFAAQPGAVYSARVVVYGELGVAGPSNSAEVNWKGGSQLPPAPQNLRAKSGTTIVTRDEMIIVWDKVPFAKAYNVRISAGAFERNETVELTEFKYSYADAIEDGGPWRSVTFYVAGVNDSSTTLNEATITLTNPTPGAPAVTVTAISKAVNISTERPDVTDFSGMMVWSSKVSGFTPSENTLVYKGPNTEFIHTGIDGINYYRVAHYDNFGSSATGEGMELSAQVMGIPIPAAASFSGEEYPGTPNEGDTWFKPSASSLYYWHNGQWILVSNKVSKTSQLEDDAGLGLKADLTGLIGVSSFFDGFDGKQKSRWVNISSNTTARFGLFKADDASGAHVLRLGGTTGDSNMILANEQTIIYDPKRPYRVRARVRAVNSSSNLRFTLALVPLDASGSFVSNVVNGYQIGGLQTDFIDTEFFQIEAYFWGLKETTAPYFGFVKSDKSFPVPMPQRTVVVRPAMRLEVVSGSAARIVDVDFYELSPLSDIDAAGKNLIKNPEFISDVPQDNRAPAHWTVGGRRGYKAYVGVRKNIGAGAPPWDPSAPVFQYAIAFSGDNLAGGGEVELLSEAIPISTSKTYTFGCWGSQPSWPGYFTLAPVFYDAGGNQLTTSSFLITALHSTLAPTPLMRPILGHISPHLSRISAPTNAASVRLRWVAVINGKGPEAQGVVAVTRFFFCEGMRPPSFDFSPSTIGTSNINPNSVVEESVVRIASTTWLHLEGPITLPGTAFTAEFEGRVFFQASFEIEVVTEETTEFYVSFSIDPKGGYFSRRTVFRVQGANTLKTTVTVAESIDVKVGDLIRPAMYIERNATPETVGNNCYIRQFFFSSQMLKR